MKVFISTLPFAEESRTPLDILEACGIEYLINPIGRKLKESELASLIGDFDVLIAGTEPISDIVLEHASKLKLISRVGIGLDSVDLLSAERRGIAVSYTPDAPSPAVAELTIGLIVTLLRSVHLSNIEIHRGEWQRHFGRRLPECVVGIIGAGRIGSRVISYLSRLGCKKVMVNDLDRSIQLEIGAPWEWCDKETIFREADIISLHVPLTELSRGMISRAQLDAMKNDALLINTARGGIIDEADLFQVLCEGHLAGVAIDAFENEPYDGPLASIDRCLLTAHMGSMSRDCRVRMEVEAAEETARFLTGKPLSRRVPREEYENQRSGFSERQKSYG